MTRLVFSTPFALIATALLFAMMYGLIKPADIVAIGSKTPIPVLPFVPPDTPPAPPERVRPEALPAAPAPVEITFTRPAPGGDTLTTALPKPTPGDGGVVIAGSTSLMPIVTLAPAYPARCQSSGAEGFATVQYDVTLQGLVTNARVTGSSHRCFERAALDAIAAWRYQPSMTGGAGYIGRGVTKRFAFELN